MKSKLLEDFSFYRALILGVLLGLTTFWNGSMLIGALMLLGGTFLFSHKKIELILIAVLSLAICFGLTYFFVGNQASVQPEWWFGMLAYPKNTKTIFTYYALLLGIMPLLYLFSLITASKRHKILLVLFLIPFLFANTVKITPDVNANHKFIIVSQIGTALGCALVIYSFWKFRNVFYKFLTLLLFFALTSTGVYDYFTFYKLNKITINHPEKDKLKLWVIKNTDPKDTFLTPMLAVHPILLAGRSIFFGWPYFAWSAGYPTHIRMPQYERLYAAETEKEFKFLLMGTSIDYMLHEVGYMHELKWQNGIYQKILKIVYQDDSKRILYQVPKEWSY